MTIDRQTSDHTMRIVLALMLSRILFFAEAIAQIYFRTVCRLQRRLTKPRQSTLLHPRRVPDPAFAQKF